MATTEQETREYGHFIGGESEAPGGNTFDDLDPFTGDVVARVAAGRPRRGAPRGRGGRSCVPGVVADLAGDAPDDLPPRGRHPRGPPRRDRRPARAGDGVHVRLRHVPDALRPGAPAPGGGDPVRAAGSGAAHRYAGPDGDGDPETRRRRRGDRAVERGAHPPGAVDRGAARARKHGRAQAVGVVTGRRRPDLGRDLHRGRDAGGRAQHRHARAGRGRADRRRARREPRGAKDQLHGLDRNRPEARRGGRSASEARRARARRLQPADRAR